MSNKIVKAPMRQDSRVTVDDGSKVFDIYNKRDEKLGQFIFRPADMGIIERYDHAVSVFEDIQNSLGTDSGEEAVKAASDRMKQEIDILFDADVSGSFFSITSPLTILETGEFFVVNVLNAIKGIIEKETGTRLKRAKTRASKYTRKYHN